MELEIFKDIPGYEGLYQVSNMGRIYSLPKKWSKGNHNGKFLKQRLNRGYLAVTLSKNNKLKTLKVHQLVAMAFLGHKLDVDSNVLVDHINENKFDNRFENLQIISIRENSRRVQEGKGYYSNYKGVTWHSKSKKWISRIEINKKRVYLGSFKIEIEAAEAYQTAVKNVYRFESPKQFRQLITRLLGDNQPPL